MSVPTRTDTHCPSLSEAALSSAGDLRLQFIGWRSVETQLAKFVEDWANKVDDASGFRQHENTGAADHAEAQFACESPTDPIIDERWYAA